jgi:hypothetical protein
MLAHAANADFAVYRRIRELRLQLNVQKFELQSVQRQSTDKVTNKVNLFDNETSEFRQKDYYTLFEKLAQREDLDTYSNSRSSRLLAETKSEPYMRHLSKRVSVTELEDELSDFELKGSLTNVLEIDEGDVFGENKDHETAHTASAERTLLSPILSGVERSAVVTPFSSLISKEHYLASMVSPIVNTPIAKGEAVHHYDRIMRNWLRSLRPLQSLHSGMSSFMARHSKLIAQNVDYRTQFDRESWRHFNHAFTQRGVLEIAPIQALHLPAQNSYVHIKISYGSEVSTLIRI